MVSINFKQPNFNDFKDKDFRKRFAGVMFFILLAVTVLYIASDVGKNEITVDNSESGGNLWGKVANLFTITTEKKITIDDDPDYVMPKPEEDRLDILILGTRGEDDADAENGGALLTDTIMLLSYDKITKNVSLVSIPRDLYVRLYDDEKGKINSAYEIGVYSSNGIKYTKRLFSRVTGVYIDNVIVLNFSSFNKIIDDLGGVDVVLDKPFSENQQWGYEFYLPEGENHLDGQNALYYVRSRFSSDDFDRARRQQQVLMAMKDKIFNLNLLKEPIKTLSILNSLRTNIDTDLKLWDIGSILDLTEEFENAEDEIQRYVINTSNLVYDSRIQTDEGNLYVLLPNENSLQGIKDLFQSILN